MEQVQGANMQPAEDKVSIADLYATTSGEAFVKFRERQIRQYKEALDVDLTAEFDTIHDAIIKLLDGFVDKPMPEHADATKTFSTLLMCTAMVVYQQAGFHFRMTGDPRRNNRDIDMYSARAAFEQSRNATCIAELLSIVGDVFSKDMARQRLGI